MSEKVTLTLVLDAEGFRALKAALRVGARVFNDAVDPGLRKRMKVMLEQIERNDRHLRRSMDNLAEQIEKDLAREKEGA